MTRKSIIMSALAAVLAATSLLTVPAATASGDHHYDCTQRERNIRRARHISAAHMQIFSYYENYANGIIDEAMRDLEENMDEDPGTLHTIASTAEQYLGWESKAAKRYLKRLHRRHIRRNLRRCPALFGRSNAENTAMQRNVALLHAELRDELETALANALDGKYGDE